MIKVLLVIHTNTYFSQLIDIARLLKTSGQYYPLILFKNYPTVQRDIAICQVEDIPTICEKEAGRFCCKEKAVHQGLYKLIDRVSAYFESLANIRLFLPQFLYQILYLRKRTKIVQSLINEQDIKLIILAGDLVAYDTAIFIQAGHNLGIKSIVIPGWMASPLEPIQAVFHNPDNWVKNMSNFFVARYFPKWMYEHNGRKLLRLPAAKVLALELFGLAPPLPWILHSGYADAIAVESEAMRDYCIKEGLPPKKIVLTGSIAGDILAEVLTDAEREREKLYERIGMPVRNRMILCALPPNMMGGFFRPECDFKDYNELVEFWVNSLQGIPGHNTIFCLHPSTTQEQKLELIQRYRICVTDMSAVRLIPLCHLFVASISSTIQWAIACGKPVINYDMYRYRYKDYESADGVLTMESQEEYKRELQLLTENEDYYFQIVSKQKQCKNFWGETDGHSGVRLLNLFNNLSTLDADNKCKEVGERS